MNKFWILGVAILFCQCYEAKQLMWMPKENGESCKTITNKHSSRPEKGTSTITKELYGHNSYICICLPGGG